MTDRTERYKREEATEAVEAVGNKESTAQEPLALSERGDVPARATKPRRAVRKSAAKRAISPEAEAEAAREAAATERANTITALESQGFSAEEAQRLLDTSKRLEHSTEAKQTRRLLFTRWLYEQGILNEQTA